MDRRRHDWWGKNTAATVNLYLASLRISLMPSRVRSGKSFANSMFNFTQPSATYSQPRVPLPLSTTLLSDRVCPWAQECATNSCPSTYQCPLLVTPSRQHQSYERGWGVHPIHTTGVRPLLTFLFIVSHECRAY